jgi:small subunit ribosomal protein S1
MAKKAAPAFSLESLVVPTIKVGQKVKGIILKKTDSWLMVSCENNSFVGVIMTKELRDLERSGTEMLPGTEIEAEIMSTDVLHEEGYYIISVTRLLQHSIWESLKATSDKDEIITVIPTEANLGGLLIDMHGIKWFIPLSQLAPVNYPRVEDGDQEAIFDKLIALIGKEFKVRIITIDEDVRRVILSEREALREEREEIMATMAVENIYDGVISGLSSYGFFVTIGWALEGLVHISEITYGHVDNVDKFGKVGDKVQVKIIWLDGGKISLSIKQVKEDPRKIIGKTFNQGDVVQWEVVRFVPYGAFVRMYEDINGLVHITEISDENTYNPAEKLKLGQVVKAKIITLDIRHRKIGLSIKAIICEEKGIPYEPSKSALGIPSGDRPQNNRRPSAPRPAATLDDVTEEKVVETTTEEAAE